jgi:hypothetical protein
MATENQILQLKDRLKIYKKKYLRKEFATLDESADINDIDIKARSDGQ